MRGIFRFTKIRLARLELLFALSVVFVIPACSHQATPPSESWAPKAAAAYLDSRENWWAQWIVSSRDHGTFCVSCHTALPYALARPALHKVLGESGPSTDEQKLIDNVTKRVQMWKEIDPYYSDQSYSRKTEESRGTEAVLNALILANYDAQRGKLSDDTRVAFDYMWALQRKSGNEAGSWPWLQFDEEPWEAKNSAYYGATLAVLATGIAPESYASTPAIRNNLSLLCQYLNREETSQPALNRVFLLWASTKLRGLLSSEQQNDIVKEMLSRQRQDGGWRLASLAWTWNRWSSRSLIQMWLREDGTPITGKSDGAATGLVTFVLQEAGLPRDHAQLQRGLSWLMTHQTAAGSWQASSINKKREPTSGTGRFMSDAATAFAVLSLAERQITRPASTSTANLLRPSRAP